MRILSLLFSGVMMLSLSHAYPHSSKPCGCHKPVCAPSHGGSEPWSDNCKELRSEHPYSAKWRHHTKATEIPPAHFTYPVIAHHRHKKMDMKAAMPAEKKMDEKKLMDKKSPMAK